MPTSDPANKGWILDKINSVNPSTILDVGAGNGTYGKMISAMLPRTKIDCIEVWKPYIESFNLKDIYSNVFFGDVREHDNFNYDIVIFGDVLEHMTESDAISVWNKTSKQAKYGIISIPIVHSPQGAAGGNPYEIHVEEDWNKERITNSFSHIVDSKDYRFVGGYFADFKN